MTPEYDDGAKEEPRAGNSFEPAFYHHLPETFYTDVEPMTCAECST